MNIIVFYHLKMILLSRKLICIPNTIISTSQQVNSLEVYFLINILLGHFEPNKALVQVSKDQFDPISSTIWSFLINCKYYGELSKQFLMRSATYASFLSFDYPGINNDINITCSCFQSVFKSQEQMPVDSVELPMK